MIGLIGKKIGMTQVFDDRGVLTPVTVVQISPNKIVGQRTVEKNGYSAVIIGSGEIKPKNVSKPYAGQFKDAGAPVRTIMELRDFEKECAVGEELGIELFDGMRFVDVIGTSKGKGFQGVIKLHGFKGGRDTHGSKFHRAHGSTGQNTYPAHTFRGMKMAGRMGGDRVTVQNLRVVKVDAENKVLLIKGAVPGPVNCTLLVAAAKKK